MFSRLVAAPRLIERFLVMLSIGALGCMPLMFAGQAPAKEETVELLLYSPMGPKYSYRLLGFDSEMRVKAIEKQYAPESSGIYECKELHGDLISTIYYKCFPSGIYWASTASELKEEKKSLVLPSKARRGDTWSIENLGSTYLATFRGKYSECAHIQGDYVLVEYSNGIHTISLYLQKGVGPIMMRERWCGQDCDRTLVTVVLRQDVIEKYYLRNSLKEGNIK